MNKKVYMGHFIDEHYRLNRKYSSKNGSGTIICKSIFAKSITENIKEYNDLSKEAKRITGKIAEFIIKSNENI